jgi:hypothetical protein
MARRFRGNDGSPEWLLSILMMMKESLMMTKEFELILQRDNHYGISQA